MAPAAIAADGVGTYGRTDDKVITFFCFGVIGFFAVLVTVLSLIQIRLDNRKDRRKEDLERLGTRRAPHGMRSAGDDGVVDSQAHGDEGADRSSEPAADGSFDPGIETGYLRRAARDHELDPALGAKSFDPGDAAGYDDRRARREAKRRARLERERRQAIAESGPVPVARGSAAPALEPLPDPDPAPGPEPIPDRPKPIDDEELLAYLEMDQEPTQVAELHALRPQRRSLAERLERERAERRREERERRARIQLERAKRERAERERLERRRRERLERLRRDREALGRTHSGRPAPKSRPARPSKGHIRPSAPVPGVVPPREPSPAPAPLPRRPAPAAGGGLIWPTAKAGLAVTLVLALAGALGSVVGLPVPGMDKATGDSSLVSSATLFGVGPGTPRGLEDGYMFPVGGTGPADYGEKEAKFGAQRYGHIHEGQDVFAQPGTPLFAVRDGVVVDGAGGKDLYAYGGGNAIVIYNPSDDRSYVYLHMRKPTPLDAGDTVRAGQQVGKVGCTGSCDGPHLHFEIRLGKVAYGNRTKPIDPLPYLQQWERFGVTH